MIARLSGTLIQKQPPLILIDVGGVGYEVEAPLGVFSDLPETGSQVVILTHLLIKDDGHTLYGFSSDAQRTLFRQLLKISGIGAKLALTILSGTSGDELARMVMEGDTASLVKLPGIGKKTAERLIIELKDKIDGVDVSFSPMAGVGAPSTEPAGEAVRALASLGYKPQEAQRMVRAVLEPDMSSEDIIRNALKAAGPL
ncbi:MAG TPA: Holliday junction branch migration protein RuvA [Xanthomonadales bacterium]|nr:Holliday junction branch migration protein RuvA [Xanthomonadales bacterium]